MNNQPSNGAGKQELTTLPEHRRSAWETQMLDYQHREHERETLRRELDDARVEIRALQTEIELYKSSIAQIESRVASCVLERDRAVMSMAKRETVLLSVFSLLEEECRDLANDEVPA
jgi:predicted  nucleic acid-binding Zn-ribbon protein